jgi:hypothetical protein
MHFRFSLLEAVKNGLSKLGQFLVTTVVHNRFSDLFRFPSEASPRARIQSPGRHVRSQNIEVKLLNTIVVINLIIGLVLAILICAIFIS